MTSVPVDTSEAPLAAYPASLADTAAPALPDVWQAVLADLQHDPAVSRASFSTWLRTTQLLFNRSDEFVVGAQHQFARDKLERSFRSVIEQAIARCVGRQGVRVRFEVASRMEVARGERRESQDQTPDGRRQLAGATKVSYEPAHVSTGDGLAGVANADREQPIQGEADPIAGERLPAEAGTSGHIASVNQLASPVAVRLGAQVSVAAASSLHQRYTFATFVAGKHNQFAYAAARAVAENPAFAYNPLFLYGSAGLGKTHLLHAIGHHALSLRPATRVLYVSAHTLAGELTADPRAAQSAQAVREKYCSADVLMVDDVHLLAGRTRATDEAFLNIFNTLHCENKQVVLAAEAAPKAISGLDERLSSRLQMGLVADVGAPDLEARTAILRAKAELLGLRLAPPALELIARRIQSNVRELEGALTRIAAAAVLSHLPLTSESVNATLSVVLGDVPRARASTDDVLVAVASSFDVAPEALKGKRRDREIVVPRQVAMYLMREETGASLAEIGAQLGGRNHSTVLHGCEKIVHELLQDERLRSQLAATRRVLLSLPGVPATSATPLVPAQPGQVTASRRATVVAAGRHADMIAE